MSVILSVRGFYGKDNPEFKKHYNAVCFCVENDLSLPKETSEFFKNKISGGSLEDLEKEYWVDNINNGIEVDIQLSGDPYRKEINVKNLPSNLDILIVEMS